MLLAFSFRAKKGKEEDFRRMLDDPESARRVAQAMGALRNTLFLSEDGRMVRLLEFPDGATPVPMAELAQKNPQVQDFLRRLGPLIEDGFDVDRTGSMEDFNRRNSFRLVFDVRP